MKEYEVMQMEIEKKIEDLIAIGESDELRAAWLEYLDIKSKREKDFAQKIINRNPVVIGGIIGALIGGLFLEK